MRAIPLRIPRRCRSSRSRGKTTSAPSAVPLIKDKLWFFASFEHVHEDASIAYSPASLTQFNALAALAAQGLIPGVGSIAVPNNVPVPFRDYLGTLRFDWAQSSRSQWFLRAAVDNYTTDNAFVQQATLPPPAPLGTPTI